MDNTARGFQSIPRPSAVDIIAMHPTKTRDAGMIWAAGTDYFLDRTSRNDSQMKPASFADTGATLLNNKDGIRNIKAVAPTAHAISDVDCNTLGTKPLAPSASEPMNKTAVVSLRSPSDEKETKDTCGVDDDAAPNTSVQLDADKNELFDPNFYKVRVDLFDNGGVKNKTRFTAKLTVQTNENDTDHFALFANFYSRGRDFKAFIEKHQSWDDWYDDVWGIFEETRQLEVDFRIKPMIAVMKERTAIDGKFDYEPLMHTACIAYEAHGAAPVTMLFYKLWVEELRLDASFRARDSKAPYKIGYYVDPARKHLAQSRQPKGLKVKTRQDFGK